MTREQFANLAESAAEFAARHPRRYRWRIVALAAAGYGVIFGALGFCFVCIGLICWFVLFASRHGASVSGIGAHGLEFALPFVYLAFTLLRSLWMRWPKPAGVRLRRREAPALFALLDEIVRASAAPGPDRVLIDGSLNASVSERPRLGLFGWPQRYLTLGLPLLGALSVEEFRAVLAHEFAHLRGRHGRFGNRIYRLRQTWAQLLAQLQTRPRVGAGILLRFAGWFAPRFSAYTSTLARAHEFESDRWSAELTGPRQAAVVLVKIALSELMLHEDFWPVLNDRARREPKPVTDIFHPMLSHLRATSEASQVQRRLLLSLTQETEADDSHPSLAERLAALGFPVEIVPAASNDLKGSARARAVLPDVLAKELTAPLGEPTALEAALGPELLPSVIAQLDATWCDETRPVWKAAYERAREVKERVAALTRKRAERGPLTLKAEWELTELRAEQEGSSAAGRQSARAVVAEFAKRHPAHVGAQFLLGQLCLQDDDPAGVAHLESAAGGADALAAICEQLIYNFLRRQGRFEEAAQRLWKARRREDEMDLANRERGTVTRRDVLDPPDLPPETLAAVRAFVAARDDVRDLFIARKRVKYLSSVVFYVVGCEPRFPWWQLRSRDKDWKIAFELQQGLPLSGDFSVVVFARGGRHGWLRERLRALPGAQVV